MLTSRISGGDRSAFDEIFRRYHQPIYRFSSAMVGPEEAKDIVQNVMAKVMTSMPDDKDFRVRPWLYKVARNECLDHMRSVRRVETGLDPEAAESGGAADPHRTLVEKDRLRRLVGDLNGLPDKQRASLVMRELSGLSYSEIGESIGSSAAGAKQLVYEARLALEQAELGRGLECEEVRKAISSLDRRRLRGRQVRAHLRSCRDCDEFEHAISERHADLRSLFPVMPAAAATGMLGALHEGASSGMTAAAGAVGSAGAGAAAATGIGSGVVVKGAVVVAILGGVGVGTKVAVDREGGDVVRIPASRTAEPVAGWEAAALPGPRTVSSSGSSSRDEDDSRGHADRPGADPTRKDRGLPGTVPGTDGSGSSTESGSEAGDTASKLTPGQGEGNGPASLPVASQGGQSRAAEASSAKPGRTGSAPPSRKPATPPGLDGGTESADAPAGGSTKVNPGQGVAAGPKDSNESPGKSSK